ncbi:UDP-glucose/GDP-mannose dehydrogenase family protein [Streptomyces sp. NBC_01142]|uniref:hypothetical protein n=1 Tax=Streptomyces sp. NBC_01142 TaxID=2975865 RepID=UPI0022527449|nr:hypothetical protein [Streptomyces sp. NBC_01142]MCX4822791.1 UDP-glucose/GDP-mannose dehydrogenase family protein [Streptomyces sp. NBC_01142]
MSAAPKACCRSTEWAEFGHIDQHRLAHRAAQTLVIDGRGTLNPDTWTEAGWTYRALGRS